MRLIGQNLKSLPIAKKLNYLLFVLLKNYYLKYMEQDHIISEVRKTREELSARFNHDLNKLFDYFKKEQKKSKAKIKNFQPKKKADSTK